MVVVDWPPGPVASRNKLRAPEWLTPLVTKEPAKFGGITQGSVEPDSKSPFKATFVPPGPTKVMSSMNTWPAAPNQSIKFVAVPMLPVRVTLVQALPAAQLLTRLLSRDASTNCREGPRPSA